MSQNFLSFFSESIFINSFPLLIPDVPYTMVLCSQNTQKIISRWFSLGVKSIAQHSQNLVSVRFDLGLGLFVVGQIDNLVKPWATRISYLNRNVQGLMQRGDLQFHLVQKLFYTYLFQPFEKSVVILLERDSLLFTVIRIHTSLIMIMSSSNTI